MPEVRRWNFQQFRQAIDVRRSPIVVGRGNNLSIEIQQYARYAVDHGCRVELTEPESPCWQEIRVLLKYKDLTGPALDEWAKRLAKMSRETHRVPAQRIRGWMDKWKWDVTVDEILAYGES